MEKFDDLLVIHDYYCHTNNYYSNDATGHWDTWSDFYNEYKDADIDYNLIFRWDIKEKDQPNQYYMEMFIMHQRKGIFAPQIIDHVDEKDFDSIKELLFRHHNKLMSLWKPFSNDRETLEALLLVKKVLDGKEYNANFDNLDSVVTNAINKALGKEVNNEK